ncbi:MAG TPA: cell division protein FtsH, partial [Anaerolineae bacterium]|nr:cell division protein FtsH [Anaerolineae bacterium]
TDAGMGYLGYATTMRQDVSPETARLIDAETRRIVEEAEALAEQVLREHEGVLHRIAEVLITKESITGDQIRQIVEQGAAA